MKILQVNKPIGDKFPINDSVHLATTVYRISPEDMKTLFQKGIEACDVMENIEEYQEVAHAFLYETREEIVDSEKLENRTIYFNGSKMTFEEFLNDEGVLCLSLSNEGGETAIIKNKTMLGLRTDFMRRVSLNENIYNLKYPIEHYSMKEIGYSGLSRIYYNAAPHGFQVSDIKFASFSDGKVGSIYFKGGRLRLYHKCGPEISTYMAKKGVIPIKLKDEYLSACKCFNENIEKMISIEEGLKNKSKEKCASLVAEFEFISRDNENIQKTIDNHLINIVNFANKNIVDENKLDIEGDISLLEFLETNPGANDGKLDFLHFSRGKPMTISLRNSEPHILYGFIQGLKEDMEYKIMEKFSGKSIEFDVNSVELEEFNNEIRGEANKKILEVLKKLPSFKKMHFEPL